MLFYICSWVLRLSSIKKNCVSFIMCLIKKKSVFRYDSYFNKRLIIQKSYSTVTSESIGLQLLSKQTFILRSYSETFCKVIYGRSLDTWQLKIVFPVQYLS